MLLSVFAVSLGAALGALLRWRLGAWLNGLSATMPLGTLAANLVGGYLVGLALAFFALRPELDPRWRLLAVTGFLGGLTTFSTFSAEVVEGLARGELGAAGATVVAHLAGSLALTGLGIATVGWLRSA
jgi:fluoride exporter